MFGLCQLLGFRFVPRIRDLKDRKLYVIEKKSGYAPLDPLIAGKADILTIEKNWDEALRLAASIRTGTVAPSVMLNKLASYPRQNALAKSLREIGRIERTLFTLDWITDPLLRRHSHAGQNKGEARNARPASTWSWPPSSSGTRSIYREPSRNFATKGTRLPRSSFRISRR